MHYKDLLSGLAIAITLLAFLPYIRSILWQGTRPHVFSWIIWGSATVVVFFAQWADGGGVGAWPIGVSGVISLCVAALAYRLRADTSITRLDWFFLVVASASMPIWFITTDPLGTVLVLTLVDALGFGPTLRKVWNAPESESRLFFGLFAVRNALVVVALEHYSVTTVVFPAVIGGLSLAVVLLIGWRGRSTLNVSNEARGEVE